MAASAAYSVRSPNWILSFVGVDITADVSQMVLAIRYVDRLEGASGELEVILKGWKQPEGAVHLVTPPGGPRPARVEVLADFLAKHFAGTRKRNSAG